MCFVRQASVLLLDDVLAALDVHTANWVVEKCLKGKLLRGRTVILVTHHVALAERLAERIVVVSSNGTATVQNGMENIIAHDPTLKAIADQAKGTNDQLDDVIDALKESTADTKPKSGKLIADEEVVLGSVSISASE